MGGGKKGGGKGGGKKGGFRPPMSTTQVNDGFRRVKGSELPVYPKDDEMTQNSFQSQVTEGLTAQTYPIHSVNNRVSLGYLERQRDFLSSCYIYYGRKERIRRIKGLASGLSPYGSGRAAEAFPEVTSEPSHSRPTGAFYYQDMRAERLCVDSLYFPLELVEAKSTAAGGRGQGSRKRERERLTAGEDGNDLMGGGGESSEEGSEEGKEGKKEREHGESDLEDLSDEDDVDMGEEDYQSKSFGFFFRFLVLFWVKIRLEKHFCS